MMKPSDLTRLFLISELLVAVSYLGSGSRKHVSLSTRNHCDSSRAPPTLEEFLPPVMNNIAGTWTLTSQDRVPAGLEQLVIVRDGSRLIYGELELTSFYLRDSVLWCRAGDYFFEFNPSAPDKPGSLSFKLKDPYNGAPHNFGTYSRDDGQSGDWLTRLQGTYTQAQKKEEQTEEDRKRAFYEERSASILSIAAEHIRGSWTKKSVSSSAMGPNEISFEVDDDGAVKFKDKNVVFYYFEHPKVPRFNAGDYLIDFYGPNDLSLSRFDPHNGPPIYLGSYRKDEVDASDAAEDWLALVNEKNRDP
eukprot:TRINITY_DN46135_c0_g1_i1.p1 TRINITY_DN46135_c0_g1~~TRINITY_DN46135_c0_g1_i1.p1  ORF type:complete len:304 (+),score=26.61 TRINITY_DN46135_c0_g1_i1:134-1045(+)